MTTTTTTTLPDVTTGQIQVLTERLKDVLQHKTRNRIKRLRLDIMTEDIELLFGSDAIHSHPVISRLYQTIQEEREAITL